LINLLWHAVDDDRINALTFASPIRGSFRGSHIDPLSLQNIDTAALQSFEGAPSN